MGFVSLTCPGCGAQMEVSDDREFGFCTFCGTKVICEKVIVEHKDGIDEHALMNRVYLFLEQGKYAEAEAYCEKILDVNPHSSEAYIGKLMARSHTRCKEGLGDVHKPLETFSEYALALRFSDENECEGLKRANEKTLAWFEEKQAEYGQEVQVEINACEEKDEALKKRLPSVEKKKEASTALAFSIIAMAFLIPISLLLCYYDMKCALLTAAFIGLLIYFLVMKRKADKAVFRFYDEYGELRKMEKHVKEKKAHYDEWCQEMKEMI